MYNLKSNSMKTPLACIALVASLFFVSCDNEDSLEELQQIEKLNPEIDQKTAIETDEITEEDT